MLLGSPQGEARRLRIWLAVVAAVAGGRIVAVGIGTDPRTPYRWLEVIGWTGAAQTGLGQIARTRSGSTERPVWIRTQAVVGRLVARLEHSCAAVGPGQGSPVLLPQLPLVHVSVPSQNRPSCGLTRPDPARCNCRPLRRTTLRVTVTVRSRARSPVCTEQLPLPHVSVPLPEQPVRTASSRWDPARCSRCPLVARFGAVAVAVRPRTRVAAVRATGAGVTRVGAVAEQTVVAARAVALVGEVLIARAAAIAFGLLQLPADVGDVSVHAGPPTRRCCCTCPRCRYPHSSTRWCRCRRTPSHRIGCGAVVRRLVARFGAVAVAIRPRHGSPVCTVQALRATRVGPVAEQAVAARRAIRIRRIAGVGGLVARLEQLPSPSGPDMGRRCACCTRPHCRSRCRCRTDCRCSSCVGFVGEVLIADAAAVALGVFAVPG